MKEIFQSKYLNNSWKGSESKSGPGSSLYNNLQLLDILKNFVINNKINSIIDCGCGDFNWMQVFDFSLLKSYLGIDIVDEIIDDCKIHETKTIKFQVKNITCESIPQCDLIICKDVLFHLSFKDAINALNNFKSSNSKFLLSTHFEGFINQDIKTGNWRKINLVDEPFNLGQPIQLHSVIGKQIGIWKL